MISEPVKPLQLSKAHSPIVVTEVGITRLPVKPLQPVNVLLFIVVIELEIVSEPVKPLQYEKA